MYAELRPGRLKASYGGNNFSLRALNQVTLAIEYFRSVTLCLNDFWIKSLSDVWISFFIHMKVIMYVDL